MTMVEKLLILGFSANSHIFSTFFPEDCHHYTLFF